MSVGRLFMPAFTLPHPMLPSALAMARDTLLAVVCTAVWLGLPACAEVPTVPSTADAAPHADDVWMVSTRRLPDVRCLPAHVTFDVERLATQGDCRRWERAELSQLLSEPDRPLVIFVHGNRYDPGSAKSQGLMLARRSAALVPDTARPRTVVFSWPSSKQGLPLRDGRAKYDRAVSEGHYLAWLLGRMEPERDVAVVAYSSGAMIALQALADRVQAERAGRQDSAGWTHRPARVHLLLVASAVRHDALAPCGQYRDVLECVDRLALFNNTSDHALKFFRFIDPGLRTEALGHEQMPSAWVPPHVEFRQFDAAPVVGGSHRFAAYLEAGTLARRLAHATLDGLGDD